MITLSFSEEELVELANHTALSGYYAIEETPDDDAWRVATLAVGILDKIEAAFPNLIDSEELAAAREMLVLRRKVKQHSQRKHG